MAQAYFPVLEMIQDRVRPIVLEQFGATHMDFIDLFYVRYSMDVQRALEVPPPRIPSAPLHHSSPQFSGIRMRERHPAWETESSGAPEEQQADAQNSTPGPPLERGGFWVVACGLWAHLHDAQLPGLPTPPASSLHSLAPRGETRSQEHRDYGCVSLNIAISPEDEYEGGGTQFQRGLVGLPQEAAVRIPQGAALIHGSQITHAGVPITSGEVREQLSTESPQ